MTGEVPGERLATPLTRAGLGGAATLGRLRRIGVVTVEDLLFHLPRRYEDVREMRTLRWIAQARPDEPVSTRVTVVDVQVGQTFRRRVRVVTVLLRDDEGGEGTAVWYGRRYVERRVHAGDRLVITGRATVKGLLPVPEFQGPEFGPDEAGSLHAGRIVPVYRLTAGVTNPTLRRLIRDALTRHAAALDDYLPASVRARRALPGLGEALEQVHFPEDFERRDGALRRLAFDELLALQVGMISRDRQRRPDTADRIEVPEARFRAACATVEEILGARMQRRMAPPEHGSAQVTVPARLTPDQQNAVESIRTDLASSRPMLRLLQGDVGSGKTAVAALALCFVADAGRQAVLLAPTDLLARQHAETLAAFLEPLGHGVTLLTGSLAAGERERAMDRIAGHTAPLALTSPSAGLVIVGTHALLQETVRFRDLALVVVDEQHRFGVAQREALAQKGRNPHVLLLTATPIPQTLAQVFYADLDVSDLRTPPAGRVPIRTGIRTFGQLLGDDPASPGRGTWQLVARELAAGRRAFVVVPLVEEDETAEAIAVEDAAAMVREALPEAARLAGLPVAEPRVGIVHGQMPSRERDAVMDAFRRGEIGALVGTTVVEVGVDVPEATVMVILNADRFGVAQLHQLRGRVGRGEWQSWCVLVSDAADPLARARLEAVAQTRDGFVLAEEDLRLRRSGDLLGVQQSGLPPLRVARLDLPADRDLSTAAREEAMAMVDQDGALDPSLVALRRELASGWLARVGAGEALPEEGGEALPEESTAGRAGSARASRRRGSGRA
jgi:ATP-dependent DNA helicase RecG